MKTRTPLSWMDTLCDRLSVVAGAFVFSQFPMFLQQYLHRLSGHRDELMRILQSMEKTSAISGKTMQEMIQKFLSNSDPDIIQQGRFLDQLIVRAHALQKAVSSIETAPLVLKPFKFLAHLQTDIAQATFQHFQPGFTTSAEGVMYAILGCVVGLALYRSIAGLIKRLTAWSFRKEKQNPANE